MKKFVIINKSGMKIRCECLEIRQCESGSFWNAVNCRCEFKKAAALIAEEECDVETNDIIQNKTVTLIKKIENCKPFVASSILFVLVSIILSGIMIYFCLKSRNKSVLPYIRNVRSGLELKYLINELK